MTKTALLIIDMQRILVEEKPYQIDELLGNMKQWISNAREKGIEIIYVRHNDAEFVTGSAGWQICDVIAPQEGDSIIDKHYNSVFKETNLHEHLQARGINQLLFAGMLTNFCVNASVTIAFELGYKVAVIENGTTTFDNGDLLAKDLIDYHENIWADCFGSVDTFEELIKEDT